MALALPFCWRIKEHAHSLTEGDSTLTYNILLCIVFINRLRALELRAEELERKAKSLETEKTQLEKKLADTTEKRDKVKGELEALGDI